MPDSLSLDITDAITIEAWVRIPHTTRTWQTIIRKEGPRNYGFYIHPDTGVLHFSFLPEGGGSLFGTLGKTSITDGVWHHVVVTYDRSYVRYYIDGYLDNQIAETRRMTIGDAVLRMGDQELFGTIDEVRIYNRTLSEEEIRDHAHIAKGAILFTDDFNDGNYDGWTVKEGEWWVTEGELVCENGGRIEAGSNSWTDYSVEASLKVYSGQDYAIDFKFRENENHYRMQTYDGYQTLKLFKGRNDSFQLLASADLYGVTPGEWHTWRAVTAGENILLYLDKALIIHYVDDDPIERGKVILRVAGAGSGIHFDDVVVKGFSEGPILLTDDFNDGNYDGWTVKEGAWWVTEGELVCENGGRIEAGSNSWTDYSVEASLKVYSGQDYAIDFKFRENENHYRMQTYDGYQTLKLFKGRNDSFQLLASADLYGVTPGEWHTWRAVTAGENILLYLDSALIIHYVDDDPIEGGKVTLRLVESSVHFDDVVVKGFSEEPILPTGIYSTFTLYDDIVELSIHVNEESCSNKIYDIEILPDAQIPQWESVEALEAPEGWSSEKIGDGVRFYTETKPLLIGQWVKFKFRVKAKRISWNIHIYLTNQHHRNIGMIVSTRLSLPISV